MKMKKGLKLLCIMLVVFTMSGCMKMNADMSIHKDKSMDYSVTFAFDKSMWQSHKGQSFISGDELDNIEEQGFKMTEYSDDSMTGYTFTKSFNNIDDISSENETTMNLNESIEDSKDSDMFTVKKGFFKNTYTLKMENSTSSEVQSEAEIQSGSGNPEQSTDTSNVDLSALTSSLDMKFNVTLPYKAISSNATTTENDGKTLVWNLMDTNLKNIEFSFEIYNMTNIYITIGIAIIITIIVIIIIKKRKPKAPVATPVPVNDNRVNISEPTLEPVTPITTETQMPTKELNQKTLTDNQEDNSSVEILMTSEETNEPENTVETPESTETLTLDNDSNIIFDEEPKGEIK